MPVQGFNRPGDVKQKSNIKSIQTGTLTFNSGTTITQTIANVDLTKAILIFDYTFGIGTYGEYQEVSGFILNANTIQFDTVLNVANVSEAHTIEWKVIEFNNVKSIQTGAATITSGTSSNINNALVSISPVNTNKSLIFASHRMSDTASDRRDGLLRTKFISNTQIQLSAWWANSMTVTIPWQVIEFN